MKHFKVQVPEGYEIDQEESTFEKIVFKPVDSKPKWEDFGHVFGWCIDKNSNIFGYKYHTSCESSRNTWPSKEEAEACLALSQLCQWRDKYNEGWKPDWDNPRQNKFVVVVDEGKIKWGINGSTSYVLSFKTGIIADKFVEDFKDLIEVAKPLL